MRPTGLHLYSVFFCPQKNASAGPPEFNPDKNLQMLANFSSRIGDII